MERALDLAGSSEPVLITGETGTGKTNLARLIHHLGTRRMNPYLEWHGFTATESDPRVYAFGRVKGAGPNAPRRLGAFGSCHGGTITVDFLDGVDHTYQSLLLEFMSDSLVRRVGASTWSKADVRLIFVTYEELSEAVRNGMILAPLYERLKGNRLHMPPLRERKHDIVPLLQYFLREEAKSAGVESPTFSADALGFVERCELPGNAWDLRRLAANAITFAPGRTLDREALVLLMHGHDCGFGVV